MCQGPNSFAICHTRQLQWEAHRLQQLRNITCNNNNKDNNNFGKRSAILWEEYEGCSTLKFYVTFASHAEQPKNSKEISCKSYKKKKKEKRKSRCIYIYINSYATEYDETPYKS